MESIPSNTRTNLPPVSESYPDCPYRQEWGECALLSYLIESPYHPSPEDCGGCPQKVELYTINIANTHRSYPLHKLGNGPGSKLKNLFDWFIRVDSTCGCEDRAAIMDAWGPEGCQRNKREILSWLRDSAHAKGIPYSSTIMSGILDVIISVSPSQPDTV